MKTAWLIEMSTGDAPVWLTNGGEGFYWSFLAVDALDYRDEQSARDGWLAAQTLDPELERFNSRVTITEHQFG